MAEALTLRIITPDRIVLDLELQSDPSAGTLRWRVTIRLGWATAVGISMRS